MHVVVKNLLKKDNRSKATALFLVDKVKNIVEGNRWGQMSLLCY